MGEVGCPDIDAPTVPVEQAHVVTAARHEDVPEVRVAMDDGDVAAGPPLREQTGGSLDKPFIERASFSRQMLAETVNEPREPVCEVLPVPIDGAAVGPGPDGDAEAR